MLPFIVYKYFVIAILILKGIRRIHGRNRRAKESELLEQQAQTSLMSLWALARQTESTWTGLKLSQIDLTILRKRGLRAFAQIGALLLAAEGKKSCCMQVNALAKWILSWIPWGQNVEEKEMKGRPPPRCELSAKLKGDDSTERVPSHGEGRNVALIEFFNDAFGYPFD
jgi:hypothetical protein